ncbi:Cell surface protein [Labilithrix luteola]|uniref:Cell surface protein n=1 Tax=Labilithrix luteola TaxID=1391654 RepID=A0A0K1Q524_9BACT|nr:hypothetical protein [Labilithrix luteola]AKV00510.1 Cell surface protein [Labilithrix luteola]
MQYRSAILRRLRVTAALVLVTGAVVAACGGKIENLSQPDEACLLGPCDTPVDGGSEDVVVPSDASRPDSGAVDASRPDSGGELDGGACAAGPGARFATSVVDWHFGTGQDFNQKTGFPEAIFGPPDANNPFSVVSLGNGGWVIVAFEGNAIVDGPGVDFTVFENPLPNFKELATVAVSDDGVTWHEFPCTAIKGPDYGYCAGVGIVYSSRTNGIDPLDPAVSGGDHYDLADLGITRARYVRITDRVDLDGVDGVFDLDAVAIVNAECP